jgi:hypothetical protein
LRTFRVSACGAMIYVVSRLSGCAYDSGVCWPAGTQAMVHDPVAPRVLALVPPDQRETVKRHSLAVRNNTPVVVLRDPAYVAIAKGSGSWHALEERLEEPIRVRVPNGVDQGRELLIRRQDLAMPPAPPNRVFALLAISFLVVIVTVATLGFIQTLFLLLRERRENKRYQTYTHARSGSRDSVPGGGGRTLNRGNKECDQWLAWVAAMTTARKVRCMLDG